MSWLVVASRAAPFIEATLRRQLFQVAGAWGWPSRRALVLLSIHIARRFGKPLAELERHVANIGQLGSDAPADFAASSVDNFQETRRRWAKPWTACSTSASRPRRICAILRCTTISQACPTAT